MKHLKRKLAGALSALLILSAAVPGTALAKTGASGDDGMVTVLIKNAPGGVLPVMTADGSRLLPLNQPVKLPKRTKIMAVSPAIKYPDGSSIRLADVKLNGKSISWISLMLGNVRISEDTTISPEFVRIGAELTEPDLYDLGDRNNRLSFQTEKGFGSGYRLETPEAAASVPLYDRETGKRAGGKFRITDYEKFDSSGGSDALFDEKIPFAISDDGVLQFQGLEDHTGYRIQYDWSVPDETMEGGFRRVGRDELYISVGVNLVETIYPLAAFEGLNGLALEMPGPVVLAEDKNETVESVLSKAGSFMLGQDIKEWTDADGTVLNGSSLAELDGDAFSVDGSGYYPVYAAYQPAEVEKIGAPAELTEIKGEEIDWGNTPALDNVYYTDAETGEAISGVFLSEYNYAKAEDTWVYLENGIAVKDRIISSDRNTVWYKELLGLGLSSSRHYFCDLSPDKDMDGSIYYYVGEDCALAVNEWVLAQPAGAEDGEGAWWHYFGSDGRAYTDGSYVADGKTYRFDEEGRCLLPGWSMKDGKRTFLDASGEPVKNTFARAGESWYYLDGDGFVAEGGEQTVGLKRNAKWYEARGDKDSWELQSFQPNRASQNTTVYYLIDETGELQRSHWNEDDTMYFGSDGRAYQNCASIVGGDLYHFDKEGLAERAEPLTNAKPSKIAAQIEKMKLEASERKVDTRDEAEAFVTDAVEAILPMGYEIATLSDAKRADGKAFLAPEDGRDGYWLYDVKITNNEAEDVATDSSAKRSARVATESTAGKFYATAENCELRLRAGMTEVEVSTDMEAALEEIKAQLDALSLTAENARDQKAAEALIEAAVNAALPEGYMAAFSYSDYVAPGSAPGAAIRAGTARTGSDGSITATIVISDAEANEVSFTRVLTIKATEEGSEEEPEEKPEEKPEDRPGEEPGDKPDNNPDDKPDKDPDDGRPNYSRSFGGSNGYATNRHAAVLDTKGSWQQDANGWRFVIASTGEYAKDAWHRIDGKWYYFGSNTYAAKGWNLIGGKWYYLDENSCAMQTGWHEDKKDGNWYLLNADGSLALVWVELGGKSYFLNNVSAGPTYTQDPQTGEWKFNGSQNLPYGAMLRDTRTPDGYRVGADGAWDGKGRE